MRVALVVSLGLAGCHTSHAPVERRDLPTPDQRGPLVQPAPHTPRIASYRIAATLDANAKRITGKETLTWRHTGVAPIAVLPFHLYMNGFKNETTVFMRSS